MFIHHGGNHPSLYLPSRVTPDTGEHERNSCTRRAQRKILAFVSSLFETLPTLVPTFFNWFVLSSYRQRISYFTNRLSPLPHRQSFSHSAIASNELFFETHADSIERKHPRQDEITGTDGDLNADDDYASAAAALYMSLHLCDENKTHDDSVDDEQKSATKALSDFLEKKVSNRTLPDDEQIDTPKMLFASSDSNDAINPDDCKNENHDIDLQQWAHMENENQQQIERREHLRQIEEGRTSAISTTTRTIRTTSTTITTRTTRTTRSPTFDGQCNDVIIKTFGFLLVDEVFSGPAGVSQRFFSCANTALRQLTHASLVRGHAVLATIRVLTERSKRLQRIRVEPQLEEEIDAEELSLLYQRCADFEGTVDYIPANVLSLADPENVPLLSVVMLRQRIENEEQLRAISRACPSLRLLILMNTPAVTAAAATAAAAVAGAPAAAAVVAAGGGAPAAAAVVAAGGGAHPVPISADAFEQLLQTCTQLRTLAFRNFPLNHVELLARLAHLRHLTTLTISVANLGDDACLVISRAVPNLRRLLLPYNHHLFTNGACHFSRLASLFQLDVRDCGVDASFVDVLADDRRFVSLRWLTVSTHLEHICEPVLRRRHQTPCTLLK